MALRSVAPPSCSAESGARAAILPSAPALREVPAPGEPGPSTSGTTDPEMPAQRLDIPADCYDTWEDITEIGRLTEAGAPPKLDAIQERALLLRADGVSAGEVFGLTQGDVLIGRANSATVTIDDPGVSRHHARLTPAAGRHLLEDLDSRNGSFVRGKRINRALLDDGDVVQLGPRVSFRYVVVDPEGEALFRQLYQSSVRDALTGAYNRRHFDERLHAELAYAGRHGTDLSLIIFDVDHFKRVNDTFGHPAGDAVLKHVVKLGQHQVRAEDVFARYGGEEFAVLLRGVSPAGAVRAAERIRTTIEVLPATHDGRVIPISVSGGVAALSEQSEPSADRLVRTADSRLYRAKREGRNRMIWRG